MPSTLSFLSQPGCHLCADALPIVRQLCGLLGLNFVEIDINSSDELIQEFALRIPVVTDPAGSVLVEGIIEKRSLRKALKRYRRTLK
jgi:hypothetical protein